MDFLERIVEERILRGQTEGRFDNLSGAGRPLDLAEDSGVDDDLKLVYKILKNANCLPPEVELRRELVTLGTLIRTVDDADERARLVREANFKILKLNSRRQVQIGAEVEQFFLGRHSDDTKGGAPR